MGGTRVYFEDVADLGDCFNFPLMMSTDPRSLSTIDIIVFHYGTDAVKLDNIQVATWMDRKDDWPADWFTCCMPDEFIDNGNSLQRNVCYNGFSNYCPQHNSTLDHLDDHY